MRLFAKHKKRIYLDYASATPVDRNIWRHYQPLPESVIAANPGSLHHEGVLAKHALEAARAKVAQVLSAHPDEIIFTSGATESNTLALIGVTEQFITSGKNYSDLHLIATTLEHPSVLEAVKELERRGVTVSYLIPNEHGVIQPKELREIFSEKIIIISCTYANNEIGTVQPVKEIAKEIRERKKVHPEQVIFFHVDATQAPGYLPLNVLQLHTDFLTLGSTKLYCPRGVGVLFKKRNVLLKQLHFGGNQEFGLRPGTVPLDLVHRFAHALFYAIVLQEKETVRLNVLRTWFEKKLHELSPEIRISGEGTTRLPFITHVAIPHIDSELLVLELDAQGIAVSSKSACKADEIGASSIVEHLYKNTDIGVIRFSYGRQTTKPHLKRAIRALQAVLQKYQKI